MDSLPNELIILIINQHLSPYDLQELSQTNQSFRNLLQQHRNSIWKAFLKRDYGFTNELVGTLSADERKNYYFHMKSLYNVFSLRGHGGDNIFPRLLQLMSRQPDATLHNLLTQLFGRDFLTRGSIAYNLNEWLKNNVAVNLDFGDTFFTKAYEGLLKRIPFRKVLALCMRDELRLPYSQASKFESALYEYHEGDQSGEEPGRYIEVEDRPYADFPVGFLEDLVDAFLAFKPDSENE